jgi:hypothetical protein
MADSARQIQAEELMKKGVALVGKMPDWFLLEFLTKLLPPAMVPEGFGWHTDGIIAARMWLSDWMRRDDRDVTTFDSLVDTLTRKHLEGWVMQQRFRQEYSGMSEAASLIAMNICADVRIMAQRSDFGALEVKPHFMRFSAERSVFGVETTYVQGQVWLALDDEDAMPAMVVRQSIETSHIQVMVNLKRAELGFRMFANLWEDGFIMLAGPEVVETDFNVHIADFAARTLPAAAMGPAAPTRGTAASDFGFGVYGRR